VNPLQDGIGKTPLPENVELSGKAMDFVVAVWNLSPFIIKVWQPEAYASSYFSPPWRPLIRVRPHNLEASLGRPEPIFLLRDGYFGFGQLVFQLVQ
jgi:hypothetical protein